MWPVGTYERFLRKIKGQDGNPKVDFFGVLFCDVRQRNAREYVLNYLNVFQTRSGKFIDFYIPGYLPTLFNGTSVHKDTEICIGDQIYKFDNKQYDNFCTNFEKDFNISYPFSSTLVLMEYKGGNFSTARKIVFELENNDNGIQTAGNLFLQIFKCAEEGEMLLTIDELSDILSSLEKKKMLAVTTNAVLNFFGVDLEPIVQQHGKIKKFKVK